MTVPVVEQPVSRPSGGWFYQTLAVLALALVLVLNQGVRRMHKGWLVQLESSLSWMRKRTRVATVSETARMVSAIRWVGRYYPGRVACVEISLGATLLGLMVRKMPRWCVGVKFNPLLHHAWVEGVDPDGAERPVAEPESAQWPYKAVLKI